MNKITIEMPIVSECMVAQCAYKGSSQKTEFKVR